MTQPYDELAKVTAVLQERSLARYQEVLTEERQLRQELAEIDHLRRSALVEDGSTHARRITGLDAQWQGWLIQRRTAINQQLALLQVRKEERQDNARLAFRRKSVASSLATKAHWARKKAQLGREEETLRALALLQKNGRGGL